MRRTLLIIWSAILMSTSAYAWNQIPFTVGWQWLSKVPYAPACGLY